MTNAVLQAIAGRRSNRGYAPRQLTEEELSAILTAAMQAPSARNTQPLSLIHISEPTRH